MIKWAYLCNDMNEKIESWGIYTNGGSLFSKMITTKETFSENDGLEAEINVGQGIETLSPHPSLWVL